MIKRIFDIAVSAIALVFLAPVFLVLAVAIFLDDPGPLFYGQTRVGLHCVPFRILKFRSMVVNADEVGGFETRRGDPRVTRLGRFLRATSLDELPQLLNVLAGHMSLVGPRPDVPAQRDRYTEEQWVRRHQVRPGITGLAQATVRSDAGPGQRLQLDLEYVGKQSFLFDLRIILMTVCQVFSRGGF